MIVIIERIGNTVVLEYPNGDRFATDKCDSLCRSIMSHVKEIPKQ